jgi:hypothetical protein
LVPGPYVSVYIGTELFYQDTNLTMFTTYVYRVTVFNAIGQNVSSDSQEVTTYGGYPRRAPQVTATALDHLRIAVSWVMPGREPS